MLNSDPLMFIETVTTKGLPQGRTVYDSRYDKVDLSSFKKEESNIEDNLDMNTSIDEETLSKLESVVALYKIAKPVLCNIKTINTKYEGIPFKLQDEDLLIKQNGEDVVININEIQEIMILRF